MRGTDDSGENLHSRRRLYTDVSKRLHRRPLRGGLPFSGRDEAEAAMAPIPPTLTVFAAHQAARAGDIPGTPRL